MSHYAVMDHCIGIMLDFVTLYDAVLLHGWLEHFGAHSSRYTAPAAPASLLLWRRRGRPRRQLLGSEAPDASAKRNRHVTFEGASKCGRFQLRDPARSFDLSMCLLLSE